MFSSSANPADSRFACVEHRGERRCVEVPLVEQLLGGLDHRGHDPRLADDAARRAHRAIAGLCCDLPQSEREPRGAGECVAPLVHRRRAGVRRLARPADPVSLDAERPEHRAERQIHRLEHRALLDMELEVGRSARELGAGLARGVEVDPEAPDRIGERHTVTVDELAEVGLVGHRPRGRRGAEERATEAGTLLIGPVDEPDGDGWRAVVGEPAEHLGAREHVEAAVEPAAVRHRVEMPADQHRALGRAAQGVPVVAGGVAASLRAEGRRATRRARLGPGPTCPSRRRAALRPRRRFRREAPSGG